MDGFEEKLGAILNNPQMMQQIMSMAQALGQSPGPPPEPPKQEQPRPEPPPQQIIPSLPGGMDSAMLQGIMGLARQSGIDRNQQNLLKALGPYLSRERIVKLEKAMRAARIATLAATALRSSGMLSYSGR